MTTNFKNVINEAKAKCKELNKEQGFAAGFTIGRQFGRAEAMASSLLTKFNKSI